MPDRCVLMTRVTEFNSDSRLTGSYDWETEYVDSNASDQLGGFRGHVVHHIVAVQVRVGHGTEQAN